MKRLAWLWDVDKDALYSRLVPRAGGKRVWSTSPPKDSPVDKLMRAREAEEEREAHEQLRACLESSPLLGVRFFTLQPVDARGGSSPSRA